jgi:hypothetical protein
MRTVFPCTKSAVIVVGVAARWGYGKAAFARGTKLLRSTEFQQAR